MCRSLPPNSIITLYSVDAWASDVIKKKSMAWTLQQQAAAGAEAQASKQQRGAEAQASKRQRGAEAKAATTHNNTYTHTSGSIHRHPHTSGQEAAAGKRPRQQQRQPINDSNDNDNHHHYNPNPLFTLLFAPGAAMSSLRGNTLWSDQDSEAPCLTVRLRTRTGPFIEPSGRGL